LYNNFQVSLLIFCFDDLFGENGVLKSPTIIETEF
jgi:hypothetical protein